MLFAFLGFSTVDLILIAMLIGCDYTNGDEGVGPVIAVEMLSEFRQIDSNCSRNSLLDPLKVFRLLFCFFCLYCLFRLLSNACEIVFSVLF